MAPSPAPKSVRLFAVTCISFQGLLMSDQGSVAQWFFPAGILHALPAPSWPDSAASIHSAHGTAVAAIRNYSLEVCWEGERGMQDRGFSFLLNTFFLCVCVCAPFFALFCSRNYCHQKKWLKTVNPSWFGCKWTNSLSKGC